MRKLDIDAWIGIMENKMETTIVYWGLCGINGKENGNHYSILINSTPQAHEIYGFSILHSANHCAKRSQNPFDAHYMAAVPQPIPRTCSLFKILTLNPKQSVFFSIIPMQPQYIPFYNSFHFIFNYPRNTPISSLNSNPLFFWVKLLCSTCHILLIFWHMLSGLAAG